MKKIFAFVLAVIMFLAFNGIVFAAVYEYKPYYYDGTYNSYDLNDLDHYAAYTWRIDLTDPNESSDGTALDIYNETIVSATLYFDSIYDNSGDTTDILHVNLLANTEASLLPNPSGDTNVTRVYDNSNYSNYFNINYDSTLTEELFSFTGMGGTARDITLSLINTAYNGDIEDRSPWLEEDSDQSDGAQLIMPANGLNHLINYAQSGIFGLGFDPDCHFENRGIKLTLTTTTNPGGTGTNAVPEPATLMLFGVGLLCFASRMRKKTPKYKN